MGVKLARHVYGYDKIVVGSSLRALLYAYYNGFPVIFTKINQPTLIDYFDPQINLDGFNLQNETFELVSANEKEFRGVSKIELWKKPWCPARAITLHNSAAGTEYRRNVAQMWLMGVKSFGYRTQILAKC